MMGEPRVDQSALFYEFSLERHGPADQLLPEAASRAIDEYLAVLDGAAFGGATPVTPKFILPADPASRWTGADKGLAFFAYATNHLIDLDHAIIADVERGRPGDGDPHHDRAGASIMISGPRGGRRAPPTARPRCWPS